MDITSTGGQSNPLWDQGVQRTDLQSAIREQGGGSSTGQGNWTRRLTLCQHLNGEIMDQTNTSPLTRWQPTLNRGFELHNTEWFNYTAGPEPTRREPRRKSRALHNRGFQERRNRPCFTYLRHRPSKAEGRTEHPSVEHNPRQAEYEDGSYRDPRTKDATLFEPHNQGGLQVPQRDSGPCQNRHASQLGLDLTTG